MKKKIELYRYPNYPLHRSLSVLPNDVLIDIEGNCYLINNNFKEVKILNSVLYEKELITSLTKQQFRLFNSLTRTNLIKYFIKMLNKEQLITLISSKKKETNNDYVIINKGRQKECLDFMLLSDYNKLSSNVRYELIYSTKKK